MTSKEANFDVILFGVDPFLINAFRSNGNLQDCTIVQEDFRNIKLDNHAVVSPANSYGVMDGGLDLYIRDGMGDDTQKRVWDSIRENFGGYQSVGSSIVIECKNGYLIHTPTMEYPKYIINDHIVFDCFWNTLQCVKKHNNDITNGIKEGICIRKILCPGFGSGTGGVSASRCSHLMGRAWKHFKQGNIVPSWEKVEEIERGKL